MPNPLGALRNFLGSYPPTESFTDGTYFRLVEMLKESWNHFKGSGAEGMGVSKLDRIEGLRWDPPVLRFTIERHGGTVMGSTRAELHEWMVNIDDSTAVSTRLGFRQMEQIARPLKVAPLVEELVQLIEEGAEDERLKRSGDGQRVTVSLRKAIDKAEVQQGAASGYKQTEQGRSKRLGKALRTELEQRGWRSLFGHRPNTFEKASR
jgi:hypothetical protein